MKTLCTSLLMIGFLLNFSGCSKPERPNEKEQIVRLNIHSEPPTLDPRLVTDNVSQNVTTMLFEGLMRQMPDGSITPAIADEVRVSEDKKTYTFHLKDSLWSNGDPLTADDFIESWKWILSPKSNTEIAYKLYIIKNGKAVKEGKLPPSKLGVKALSPHTLIVELEYPAPYFLELVSSGNFYPTPTRIFKQNPDWANNAGPDFVSNGPFKLDVWDHNNRLQLSKNPNYWDDEAVRLKQINIAMVEDANTELSMFEDGELDFAGSPLSIGLPTDAIPALKASGKLHTMPMASIYFYVFNTKKPPFNNDKIRRAFAYAINRHDIVEHITQSGQVPAMAIIPPSLNPVDNAHYFQDANITEAKKLFDEGLKALKLTRETLPKITISYNTSEGHHKIAQAVQQQWKQTFGIDIALENLEWKVYLDKLQARDFMVARLGWIADFGDPITFLDTFELGDNPQNPSGWENPRYKELIEEIRQTANTTERNKLIGESEELIMEEMPIAPVYFHANNYLINPRLKGVYINKLGFIDFRWAYFEQ